MRPGPLGYTPGRSKQYAGYTPGPVAGDYDHGTRQRYQGNRTMKPCRCALCKEENALYTRARRKNRTVEEQRHYEALPDLDRLIEITEYDDTYGGLLP